MEINITSLLENDQFPLSHSQAEGGDNAGRNTWKASLEAAQETALLDTPEKLHAMRDFALASGGWSKDEIAAWSDQELNALFLQWIAGDCREAGADCLEEIDWEQYEEDQKDGLVSSNLFRTDAGEIFFSLAA